MKLRRKVALWALGVFALLFGGMVLAQGINIPGVGTINSLKDFVTDPGLFLLAVIGFVQACKSHYLTKYMTKKWETITLAYIFAIGAQFAFWVPSGWVPHSVFVTIFTGAIYATVAVGGTKWLKDLFNTSWFDAAIEKVVGAKLETAMKELVDELAATQAKQAAASTPAAKPNPPAPAQPSA